MRVGVTGTRAPISDAQRGTLYRLLSGDLGPVDELHDGGCTGADEEANWLATNLKIWRVGHPPLQDTYRGCSLWDEEREPKDYLVRNHELVDESDLLIALPGTFHELLQSGTWATVRYARTQRITIIIVPPDGTEVLDRLEAVPFEEEAA